MTEKKSNPKASHTPSNVLLVTKSKEDAQALRTAVMSAFHTVRPWVCVLLAGEECKVTVDGPWGSRLVEEEEAKIRAFASAFNDARTKINSADASRIAQS
jgi:hypothetical protein